MTIKILSDASATCSASAGVGTEAWPTPPAVAPTIVAGLLGALAAWQWSLAASPGQGFVESATAAVTAASGRATFPIQYSGGLSASNLDMYRMEGGTGLRVGIENNKLILAEAFGAGRLATGTTTLAVDTTYRITFSWTIASTTVNEFRVFIDDALTPELTVSNATLSATNDNTVRYGVMGLGNNSANTFMLGWLYVDDLNTLDNPVGLRITVKRPASHSTNAWNTNLGANPANRWENVNERPLSTTNGWEHTALSAVEESYGIDAAAAGDTDISGATILGHGAWIWAKGGAGGLGAPQLIRNGTDVAVTLTSSPAYYVSYATSGTYPSGVIGMKSAGVLDTTFLYEAGMLVAYTPGGAPSGDDPPRRTNWQQAAPILAGPMYDDT